MDPDTELRIRRLRTACGCKSGLVAMLAALAAYAVASASSPGGPGVVHQLLVGAGVALGGAVVGKVAGLLWARVRLALLLRNLAAAPGGTT
jgi:hypothetical protein